MSSNLISRLLCLFLLVVLSYFFSLNAGFISDDQAGILHDRGIAEVSVSIQHHGLIRGVELYTAHSLGGFQPIAYRAYNLIFHIGSTIAVYGLLSTLMGGTAPFIAAAIFAVHPLLSESVIWISAYSYPQYTFFFLLSWWAYVMFALRGRIRFFALSLVAYVISLASSEKAVVLPIILLAYEYIYTSSQNWRRIVPYLIPTLLFMVWVAGNIAPRIVEFQSINHVASLPVNPIGRIVFAVGTYLWMFFLPIHLTFYHMPDTPIGVNEMFIMGIPIVIVATLCLQLAKHHARVFFWYCFFLITLFPTVFAFGFAVTAAERYAYLAILGLIVPIAQAIASLSRRSMVIVASCLVFLLMVRTAIRAVDWQTEEQFWRATARTSPQNGAARNNNGAILFDLGDCVQAVPEFEAVIRLRPTTSEALHNLGLCYDRMGREKDALHSLNLALVYKPAQWQSRLKRVEILQREGRVKEMQADIRILRKIGVLPTR